MNIKCLVCSDSKNLKKFKCNYEIYNCKYCKLYFCPDLVEIEGISSPVDEKGIKMMEDSFFKKIKKIALHYAKKRIVYFKNT